MLSTLVLTLWAAGAAQGTVVLLPVEVAEFGEQTQKRRTEVEEALRIVLGARLKKAPNGTPICDKPSCFQMLVEAQGADEVAHVTLRKREADANGDASFGDFTVRVFDADGQQVLALTETLPRKDVQRALQRVCTRAFDASAHAGRIEIKGLRAEETVMVDGLPLTEGLARFSVGPHTVTARDADGNERSVEVMVPYGGAGVAELPVEETAAAAAPRPLWPALVAISAAAGGIVLSGAAVGVGLFDRSTAADARDIAVTGLPLRKADPAGEAWEEGYGENHGGSSTPTARARWTAITSNFGAANELAANALFGTAAIGLVIAAASGYAAWALWPASEPE